MKLAFLENVNEYNDHILRLYDFDSSQAKLFRQTIEQLVNGKEKSQELTSLPFIENINCTLTLRIADNDEGITTTDQKNFFCDLTISNYHQIIKLLEPFCRKESKGFQFLYEIDNPIEFLFSPNGTW